VSKKTRSRGSAPASSAAASHGPASAPERSEADEFVQRILSGLWTEVESGDPLRAEIETSTCMGNRTCLASGIRPRSSPSSPPFWSTGRSAGNTRRRRAAPVLMTLGAKGVKKSASRALAELTDIGIYPPEWVTEIGKVTPGQAWRRYDVFGDDEAIAATFSYGDSEHGVVVQVDLTASPSSPRSAWPPTSGT